MTSNYTDTEDQTDEYQDCIFNDCNMQALIFIPEVQTTFFVLYSLVSLVGIVGNVFIIFTVLRYKLGQKFHFL